jgi:small-conductance mechanosensitive channel
MGGSLMEIKQAGSHLDHLVRQTRMHHTQLSSMADMKANMLLTITSVVITLSVGYITQPHLKWAIVVLIAFCLMTIGLATYAVMPKIPFLFKRETRESIKSPGFNLLFFADFVRLTYEEFETSMEEVMNDPSLTYEVQVKELYTLGMFLAKKKYRFLRLAYITFIIGAFASAIIGLFSGVVA